MTAPRSRKEHKAYKKHCKQADPKTCTFCRMDKGHNQFVEGMSHFKIIKNRFPYSIWDGQSVSDHLMIVPRRHSDNLGNMTTDEKVEFVDIIEKYEKRGYNFYARTSASVQKSIFHQHTHLIKPTGPAKHFVLLIKKPFIRITH